MGRIALEEVPDNRKGQLRSAVRCEERSEQPLVRQPDGGHYFDNFRAHQRQRYQQRSKNTGLRQNQLLGDRAVKA